MKRTLLLFFLLPQLLSAQVIAREITDVNVPYVYTAPPVSKTYATLDPSNKSPNVSLSGGNLTFSRNGGIGICRSTIGVTSGKWYWEFKINSFVTAPDFWSGLMLSSNTLSGNLGATTTSLSFVCDGGDYWQNGGLIGFLGGSTYPAAVNDVFGFELDMQLHTLTVYRNDVVQTPSPAWTVLVGGKYFPAFSVQNNAVNITVNFGSTAFTYTGHTSFNQGIYQ